MHDPSMDNGSRVIRHGLWLVTCFCLLAGLLPLAAQARPVTLDPGSDQRIGLAPGEGRVLRFPGRVESLFVADPAIADVRVVSDGVAYVYAKSLGATDLIALGAEQQDRGRVRLEVRPEAGTVRVDLAGRRALASGSTDSVASALAVQGTLDSQAAEGQPALNLATYEGAPQVNIRVRFAEVSRQQLLSYGVNWNALVNAGNFTFGLVTGGPLAGAAAEGATNLIGGGFSSGSGSVDVLLDALQSNGLLEILAEPNITAMTGQTASFLAGGEIPVPVPVGNELVGIEYKPYGVSLTFTPTLLPGDRIGLRVRPEVSSLSGSSTVEIAGLTVPTFRIRRADTQVEVGSGQTFAIAGLFQRDNTQDMDRLPLLGDLPVLGALFRSKRFQQSETELVILITPYLVEPSGERELATPLDPASANPAWQLAGGQGLTRRTEFGFHVD
nr:type II and III secretion system protein family protein [Stutzerimonas urumqiensis]